MNPYRDNAMSTNQEYRQALKSALEVINEQIKYVQSLLYSNETNRSERLEVLFAQQNNLLERLKNS